MGTSFHADFQWILYYYGPEASITREISTHFCGRLQTIAETHATRNCLWCKEKSEVAQLGECMRKEWSMPRLA